MCTLKLQIAVNKLNHKSLVNNLINHADSVLEIHKKRKEMGVVLSAITSTRPPLKEFHGNQSLISIRPTNGS